MVCAPLKLLKCYLTLSHHPLRSLSYRTRRRVIVQVAWSFGGAHAAAARRQQQHRNDGISASGARLPLPRRDALYIYCESDFWREKISSAEWFLNDSRVLRVWRYLWLVIMNDQNTKTKGRKRGFSRYSWSWVVKTVVELNSVELIVEFIIVCL